MKRFLAVIQILLFFIVVQNCKKSSTGGGNNYIPQDTTPMVTAVGNPIGNPVNKTIDANGGAISSPDGVLKLIIPAGALSAATNISIQAVQNEIPNGLYNGYSLTPNGLQFQTPVTLEFHYNDMDLDTVDPGGLTVAYQVSDQTWEAFTDVSVDTSNKTVSVQSTHFTIFDLLPSIRISPEQGYVQVGKKLSFVQQVHFDANPNSNTPALVRLTSSWENVVDGPATSAVWAVNNVTGGNATYGTITTSNNSSATFTAPSRIPNPSTVWVTLTKQYARSRLILRSKLTIVDGSGYHVHIFFHAEDNENGSYFNWTDMGDFDVMISGADGTVKNINNPNALITLDSNISTCITSLVSPPVGPINITWDSSASSYVLVLPSMNSVLITFPAMDQSNYIKDAVWSTQCPGDTAHVYGGGYGPPFPANLQFNMVNSTQTFTIGQYIITVTPIR